ncbi:MFS transporter [Microbaculum marinum]|uniref:MFS transporter n=1 Tax=Microbaculum marinum TaxID=1764581 RepID=A0AAW9RZ93_9HYPH
MTTATAPVRAPALTLSRIVGVSVARAFLFATFMSVAASIPLLKTEWNLSASAAGAIISSFTVGYAISLFVFAWASDHYGAKRMAIVSAVLAAATSVVFGLFARDWWSAFILYGAVGLAQGGVYTPLIVLFSDEAAPAERGTAMGWLIGSTSVGYAASLGAVGLGIAVGGWQTGFILSGLLPAIGAVLLIVFLRPLENRVHARAVDMRVRDQLLKNREAGLLVSGYTAHSWELLGMWAWIPAFLAASFALSGSEAASATVSGAYLSGFLHLFGATAAFSMGRLSDRTGRKPVLIGTALVATVLSFTIGWMISAPAMALVPVALVYAFVCLGDSPVLSTAVAEAVRPGYLGAVLAWRSLLGFGAGAIAPIAFGAVLDATNAPGGTPTVWGPAFMMLGIGGALATICALALKGRRQS